MAEKNKNQTAQERARLRELIGAQASNRFCAADSCPTKDSPILKIVPPGAPDGPKDSETNLADRIRALRTAASS